ncbi:MAG TPA: hypothetical protein DEB10_12695 [Ruminococcaceae bacterium]|nr:hypothetical protein [Oscillospiraceae bacterium]
MKKNLFALTLTLVMLVSLFFGCAAAPADTVQKAMPEVISGEDNDEYGGADAYGNAGDHAASVYYGNPDFYNMESDDQLTILKNFKTFQQTTEYSCGAASALMALTHFGIDSYSELALSELGKVSVDEDTVGAKPGSANNYYEYGTNVGKLVSLFEQVEGIKVVETSYRTDYADSDLIQANQGYTDNDVGNLPRAFESVSLYASENDPNTEAWVENASDSYFVKWVTGHLKNNELILVEWSDWDGHWQVIIGYDTLGTPGIGDDIIIFADPYDTSDHWQDGYYYYPAERWFYMWNDRNVAAKPFQLQPYVVVAKG